MKQHFSAHGLALGSREIPNFLPGIEGKPEIPKSLAYFCRHCGELWARIHPEGTKDFCVRYMKCLKCGDGRLSSAPHWQGDLAQFADDWPAEAVKWEFDRLLERAEKELGNA